MPGIRPADRLNLCFLLFLVALVAFFRRKVEDMPYLALLYTTLILIQVFLIRLKNREGAIGWVYDLIFPTLSILLIFDSLGLVIHSINPKDIDGALIRLDYILFGGHPTVMMEKMTFPLLTDLLQVAYTSYYFLPITLGIVLKIRKEDAAFDRSIFLIMLCFYLSYIGYMLMPAIGPRFTLNHLQSSGLDGIFITKPMQELLNKIEGIKRDAFPSGHTAVALTVLYLAWRLQKGLFIIFLPFVTALIFSTVYLRYHYVVDVLAGVLLALLTILIGETYYGRSRKRIDTHS